MAIAPTAPVRSGFQARDSRCRARSACALWRRGAVLVGADVVDVENVDARQAQALQAVLERGA
jgi:hypothetical protein